MQHYSFQVVPSGSDIMHYGIKGQQWGVRKYQNEDGSLTEAGKIRYGDAQRRAGRIVGGDTANDRVEELKF